MLGKYLSSDCDLPFNFLIVFVPLPPFGAGIKPRALHLLFKYSTTEIHPQPQIGFY